MQVVIAPQQAVHADGKTTSEILAGISGVKIRPIGKYGQSEDRLATLNESGVNFFFAAYFFVYLLDVKYLQIHHTGAPQSNIYIYISKKIWNKHGSWPCSVQCSKWPKEGKTWVCWHKTVKCKHTQRYKHHQPTHLPTPKPTFMIMRRGLGTLGSSKRRSVTSRFTALLSTYWCIRSAPAVLLFVFCFCKNMKKRGDCKKWKHGGNGDNTQPAEQW